MSSRALPLNFKSPPSVAYFILYRDDEREHYVEVGVDANNELFIRRTCKGAVLAKIPIGPCTADSIEQLQNRLDAIAEFMQIEE